MRLPRWFVIGGLVVLLCAILSLAFRYVFFMFLAVAAVGWLIYYASTRMGTRGVDVHRRKKR